MKILTYLLILAGVFICFERHAPGQETVSISLPALRAMPDRAALFKVGWEEDYIDWFFEYRSAVEADLSLLDEKITSFNKLKPEDQTTAAVQQIEALAAKIAPDIEWFNKTISGVKTALLMMKMPDRLGFDSDSAKRLVAAIKSLHSVDRVEQAETEEEKEKARKERAEAWKTILARQNANASLLSSLAAKAPGLAYPSGTQKTFSDCTIFALATATGRPYGWVAGLTAEMLKQAEWRSQSERQNPATIMQKTMLNGGEVLIMTEILGQVKVIPESQYEETLKRGTPLMLAVYANKGGHHQVVLSKTFRHENKVWYEIIDSYKGAAERLYVTADELKFVQSEAAIVYHPDEGRTPLLLR